MNIDEINKKVKQLNQIKRLLKQPINNEDTVDEKIFKKYLEVESVAKVADYINQLGYKIENRKYVPNDISYIITNKDTEINNKELKKVVIKLFHNHKKGIRRTNW